MAKDTSNTRISGKNRGEGVPPWEVEALRVDQELAIFRMVLWAYLTELGFDSLSLENYARMEIGIS